MNAELTELVFILDRSGSMGGLESDTIGGFNGMIERQKKEGEKVNVTTILFDDEVEIIHDRFPIDAVQPLTDKEYYVRGCTALLDAVGQAINKIDNVQKHLPEEHRAGKVLFVITTDGLENSSTEFNYNDIKRMIEAKKECGWEFLFLGANIDAGKEAEKIGIERNRSVTYENDHDGVALNYEAVGRAVRGVTKSRLPPSRLYAIVQPCFAMKSASSAQVQPSESLRRPSTTTSRYSNSPICPIAQRGSSAKTLYLFL